MNDYEQEVKKVNRELLMIRLQQLLLMAKKYKKLAPIVKEIEKHIYSGGIL